jgi:hypothetical protein
MGSPFVVRSERGPVLATAIHAGHDLRDEIAARTALDDAARLREEDPFTDLLIPEVCTSVVVRRSRFELDLNRPRERAVYRRPEDAWGLELWTSEAVGARQRSHARRGTVRGPWPGPPPCGSTRLGGWSLARGVTRPRHIEVQQLMPASGEGVRGRLGRAPHPAGQARPRNARMMRTMMTIRTMVPMPMYMVVSPCVVVGVRHDVGRRMEPIDDRRRRQSS